MPRSIRWLPLLTVLLAAGAQAAPPPGWKKLTDRKDRCVAFVPADWSVNGSFGAADAPGHAAGILMNSNQTRERADATWNLYKPEVVEDSPARRVGRVKGGKALDYLVQAPGKGFVCSAFLDVEKQGDLAKYGEVVKRIADSIHPI